MDDVMDEVEDVHLPWFPLYPGDFLSSEKTTCMGATEVGAYMLLLMYQWKSKDCTLPSDRARLAKLSRLNGDWDAVAPAVLECFEKLEDGRLRNPRLYFEWEKSRSAKGRQIKGGKKTADKRRNSSAPAQHEATSSLPEGYLKATSRLPEAQHEAASSLPCGILQSQSHTHTHTQEDQDQPLLYTLPSVRAPESKKKPSTPTESEAFTAFWKNYPGPRKKRKSQCWKLWRERKLDPLWQDGTIPAGLKHCSASMDWTKDGGRFIEAPEVWLRGSGWENEMLPAAALRQRKNGGFH